MASLFKNKKIKLIAATSTAIFNLAAVFSAVGAWWVSATKANEGTNQIVLNTLGGVNIVDNTWDIYGFDLDTDTPVLSSTDFVLGDYDVFIPVRNINCRKTIHVKLEYPQGVLSGKCLKIDISYSGAYKDGTSIKSNISNLVEFKYFVNDGTISTEDQTQDGVEATYYALHTKFDTITSKDTFVNADTHNKANISNTSSIPLAASSSNYTTDLFIQYDYNEKLTTQFNDNFGSFNLDYFKQANPTDRVKFTPDITSIAFSLGDYTGS